MAFYYCRPRRLRWIGSKSSRWGKKRHSPSNLICRALCNTKTLDSIQKLSCKKKKKSYWAFQEGKSWILYQAQVIHPWSWAWREDQHGGLKVTQGWRISLHCMLAPSCGFLHRDSYTRTNSASRRTWSELKWNYRGSAGSTVRERVIPQEEWGWWVSRQQRHLHEMSSTPLAPPLSLWGQASSRHICTMWRHSWPKGLE